MGAFAYTNLTRNFLVVNAGSISVFDGSSFLCRADLAKKSLYIRTSLIFSKRLCDHRKHAWFAHTVIKVSFFRGGKKASVKTDCELCWEVGD